MRTPSAFRFPSILFLLLSMSAPGIAAAATLTGRVHDPDDRPVPGVHVVVTAPLGTAADCITDAGGTFVIGSLGQGEYQLRVLADGFQADALTISLSSNETRDVTVRLHLSAVTESIVVSASQVDVPLSRALDPVTVITAADLQARQVDTIADALRLVPGLAVTRSGGRGGLTSLFPRGGASNYTLVLVDGIRANAFGGGYDFAHLPVADVDHVEIVRGPQSALFGADAIGAVVQIVTRRGGRPRVDGVVEGGGQGTTRAAVGAVGSTGAWKWGASAERSRSDGFRGAAPATGERVTNDDDRMAHVSGSLGWQRPNGPDLLVAGNVSRDQRGFPGPFGANPIGAFRAVDRVSRGANDTRQVGARFTHPWSPRIRQRVDASYTDLSSDFNSPFGVSSSGTRRVDARFQEDVAFSRSLGASAGVELLQERGSSTFITGTTADPLPVRRRVTGVFAEVRYVGRERLFATGGMRIEQITRDALAPNTSPYSPRPAFPETTVDSVNPKVSVSYLVKRSGDGTATTKLRASAGTGIRAPDAFEIAFTDNPNLRPERSRSTDAGIEQQLGGGAIVLGATAFFNRYDDLIVAVGRSLQDASQYQTDNISNARAKGVELTGDARLAGGLTIRANYTLVNTAILSVSGAQRLAPPPFTVGDPLIRRPRHQGSLGLTYAVARISAYAELTSRSRVLDVEPTLGAFGGLFFTPGYAVINAGASVRLARGLDLYARVLNLADRAYEETLGYPALRRSVIVGLRVAASR
jgi:outer membrane cobalamin receptor